MLSAIFLSTVISCWLSVVSADISITRDINDLIQFPNCSSNIDNFCDKIKAIPYLPDKRLCICQCKSDYVMYRDPGIDRKFQYKRGKARCEWWSRNHEGMHECNLSYGVTSAIVISMSASY